MLRLDRRRTRLKSRRPRSKAACGRSSAACPRDLLTDCSGSSRCEGQRGIRGPGGGHSAPRVFALQLRVELQHVHTRLAGQPEAHPRIHGVGDAIVPRPNRRAVREAGALVVGQDRGRSSPPAVPIPWRNPPAGASLSIPVIVGGQESVIGTRHNRPQPPKTRRTRLTAQPRTLACQNVPAGLSDHGLRSLYPSRENFSGDLTAPGSPLLPIGKPREGRGCARA